LSEEFLNEPMLEMYIFETTQNTEQLEKAILSSEKENGLTSDAINDIFRYMHTIKGSSAMMLFHDIAALAHAMEDLFYFIREEKPTNIDYTILSDLVLDGVDFIKVELTKIKNTDSADGDASCLIESINNFLLTLKKSDKVVLEKSTNTINTEQYYLSRSQSTGNLYTKRYKATVFFDQGCEMENLRAYNIIHNIKEFTSELYYLPQDIIENDESISVICEKGFQIFLKTDKDFNEIHDFFMKTIFLKNIELEELEDDQLFEQFIIPNGQMVEESYVKIPKVQTQIEERKDQVESQAVHQSIISVHVDKLDKLMDMMGEMVIAEAMVTQNPELQKLKLESFHKAALQLRKITHEVQDMVMSIRMVPISSTFQKMHRIVRDMSKKLGKEVQLKLIGEETEVDKNVIEHISDPLMHLVRNALDHGIEAANDRIAKGKSGIGLITLEAKHAGSDVLVIVKDDGKGLNKDKILQKGIDNGILQKPSNEMTDKEIYNLIMLPGFSTKDNITEFSGRGVGMNVVTNNLETVGGSVTVDSVEGVGTTMVLKIPLTLAIIDGMNIRVGNSKYTLPTISIKESFRPKEKDIIRDTEGHEMIMVRGQCYSILRIHEIFEADTKISDFTDGILIMVEQDGKSLCLFADELLGQQQVVVKALPNYIKKTKKIEGLAGCTLLGDGSISLILSIGGLLNMKL
jgi:Chemotaxis protein histidine kinase and related kinases